MTRTISMAVALGVWLAATPARAQQPAVPPAAQRQLDSLNSQIRVLRARLDSLLAALARRPPARPADTTAAAPAVDDLAALRAAAAAAAGQADTSAARPDTTPPRFVGRERNLSQLNPEISVTGDVRAYGYSPGVQRDNFDPREFEIGFQSALDPYSHTKIFVALEGGEVDVEEGYAYWTGLPGRIRLDIGKFRQQFGELNRWHLHALPETEYPLALRTYLGEDGLSGTGLSVYTAVGGLGTHELTAQVTRSGSDAALFAGGAHPTYLGRLLNFWQLTGSTYMQLGGTVLYGTNPDSALKTMVGGVDFRLTWRPPSRAMYREWTLRGELFALRKRTAGSGPTRLGGYASTTYKLNQRVILGAAYNYVEDPGTGAVTRTAVPSLTWWQSEWVFLRAQYRYENTPIAGTSHQVALQAVWAIGPHKHETY